MNIFDERKFNRAAINIKYNIKDIHFLLPDIDYKISIKYSKGPSLENSYS